MPALGVPNCSSHRAPQDGVPCTSALTTRPPRPAPIRRHSKKTSEPPSSLDAKILQAFINAKPFSSDAAELLDSILEGNSELFKIPRRRQISMLYRAFQHSAAEPFHKGKKASAPRFNVNPKSVASFCSGSPDYVHCRLEGYPLKTQYPESASELQQWCPWEATTSSGSLTTDDEVSLEVTDITETLVFRLVSAFLRGSEYEGTPIALGFQRYQFGN